LGRKVHTARQRIERGRHERRCDLGYLNMYSRIDSALRPARAAVDRRSPTSVCATRAAPDYVSEGPRQTPAAGGTLLKTIGAYLNVNSRRPNPRERRYLLEQLGTRLIRNANRKARARPVRKVGT
jgi:hypothetical protein